MRSGGHLPLRLCKSGAEGAHLRQCQGSDPCPTPPSRATRRRGRGGRCVDEGLEEEGLLACGLHSLCSRNTQGLAFTSPLTLHISRKN